MKILSPLKRLAALILSWTLSFGIFGISLSILWAITGKGNATELTGACLSAGLAVVCGGFFISWITGDHSLKLSGLFGLLSGGISFLYILGFELAVLLYTLVFVLLSCAGGLLFRKVVQDRSRRLEINFHG